MSGKFMKVLKILIPTLTLVLIASQLLNSCAVSQNELLEMYERQQAITIEIAYPENQEQGTEKELEWTELAFLTSYPEFRTVFDTALGITQNSNGKQGSVYVNLEGNHTNNSTLRYAFANKKFHDTFWNNLENLNSLGGEVNKVYADIEDSSIAKMAILNAYFNIFPDAEPNYFNGNQTLTRGEYLAGVYRAGNPVSSISSDSYFESYVDPAGTDQSTIYASQLQDYSYLTTEDNSLNSGTFQGTITRAEAVYTLVKLYYADEFNAITGSESAYSDAKNAGDLALEAGFKAKDGTVKDYWKSYELSYAVQNPDKGLPSDLYRALVVAKNHNLLVGQNSRWEDGLTKSEAISLITRVYEDLGAYTNSNGASSTIDNNNNDNNENQNDNDSSTIGFEITEEDFYYTKDGKLEYTLELVEFVKSFDAFSDLDNKQIIQIIESQIFADFVEFGSLLGNIQKKLTDEFSNPTMTDYIISTVVTPSIPSDPSNNTGYGDTSKVEDSNKGGSDENEKTSGDEQQGTDMSDKVDETTGQLKPTATPIPTDTPVEEGPSIEVTTPEDEKPQFTYTSIYKTMYATDAVNTRKGPSTDFEKTGNLKKGQQVAVIGQCNETNWFMIQDGADIMFVTSKYLTETPPATPTPMPTVTPTPTEAPKQDTGTTSEITKPDGTQETQTITFTYEGLDENKNKVTYEKELTVQGTYINGYFVVDGLGDKVGYGIAINKDRNELEAWREKYPNLEYTGRDGKIIVFPAGRDLHGIGNYNGDGLNAN